MCALIEVSSEQYDEVAVVVPQLQGVGGGVVDQAEGLQRDAARRPQTAPSMR